MKDQPLIFWLVVWNIFYHFLFFHILGIIIIPTDELTPSFFRGVFVKPPTSFSIGNSGVSSQDMVLELALLVDAEISWQFEPVGGLGLFVAFMHQISHLGRWKFSNSCRTPQKIEEVDFFFSKFFTWNRKDALWIILLTWQYLGSMWIVGVVNFVKTYHSFRSHSPTGQPQISIEDEQ